MSSDHSNHVEYVGHSRAIIRALFMRVSTIIIYPQYTVILGARRTLVPLLYHMVLYGATRYYMVLQAVNCEDGGKACNHDGSIGGDTRMEKTRRWDTISDKSGPNSPAGAVRFKAFSAVTSRQSFRQYGTLNGGATRRDNSASKLTRTGFAQQPMPSGRTRERSHS